MAQRYQKEIAPALMKRFGHTNALAVPRLVKIVLNIGCGEAAHDAKVLEQAQRDLAIITGQRPAVTRAKIAVSNFKIKEGDLVGCKVTLRRARMHEFLDRLISAALPRIRDFRGLSAKGFDGTGNYSFGIREQTIFPELHLDEVQYPLGMDVVIVTTAKSPERSRALLEAFGMPFERPSSPAA
jgi:large subunit ribosomal protein L5